MQVSLPSAGRLTALPAALLLVVAMAAPMGAQSEQSESVRNLDGTWTVDPSIGSFEYGASDFSGTWVGYRAQEELVGVGGVEAVGRTPDVTGAITLEGNAVTGGDLTADLTTLQSDQRFRDGQLGRQGIQTDQFPTATFVLTEPIVLETLPAEGESISADAVGDLTIHGVTQSVTIPLAAVWQGDIIGVGGSLTFPWELFDMERPSSMRVVSLADEVTLELQVFFRQEAIS